MRIRGAVRLAILLIAGLMVLHISFSAYFNRSIEAKLEDLTTSSSIRNLFDKLNDTTNEYFLYRLERAEQQWLLIHSKLLQLLDSQRYQAFQKRYQSEELRAKLQLMGNSFNKLFAAIAKAQLSKDDDSQELRNRLITQITLNARGIAASFDDISRNIERELLSLQRWQSLIDIVALIFVALFVIVISLFLSKSVVRPILKFREGAETIGRGNLDYRIETAGPGEIQELSRAFNKMTANLQELTVSRDELAREMEERQRAEEGLRVAHQQVIIEKNRLEAMMEALPVGVAILDDRGGDIRSNSMFEQVWGIPRPLPQGINDYAAYKAWWVDTGEPVKPKEWASARAVKKRETVIGQRMEIEGFNGKHRFILNSAAPILDVDGKVNECAVAILDITELQRAEESLKHQHDILAGINRIFMEALVCETEAKLGATCLTVMEELTRSRFGFICEVNQAGHFDTIAISNPGWSACKIPISAVKDLLYNVPVCGIRGKVIETGNSLLCNNPDSHPDIVFPPEGHPPITAFLGVPLKHANQTIGMIALGNKEGGYTDTDREDVETLAPVIVEALMRRRAEIAVRQAKDELEQRVRERTEELTLAVTGLEEEVTERQQAEKALQESERTLRYLASKILTAQEEERNRIAKDLHEGLGQSMSALKLFLRSIQHHLPAKAAQTKDEFDQAQNLLREMIEEVRRISEGLSPVLLENLGLTAALEYLVDGLSKLQKITTDANIDGIDNLFTLQTAINLFRVFQESFHNIVKHAQATQVWVTVERGNGRVNFLIKDNGVGFDLKQIRQTKSADQGMGLESMEERLRMIGARLNIKSQKGMGTEISFSIPIDAN